MQLTANTTAKQVIDPARLRHAKWENDLDHASLKAKVEVINKTKGDEEHTFLVTQYLNDTTIIVHAQNGNTSDGTIIYSRAYLVATKAADIEFTDVEFTEY